MPNGKPIAPDIEVLKGFEEPFIVNGVPRDERMAKKWGCHVNQVYVLWNKKRFDALLEYGVSQRSGWLTTDGVARLKILREIEQARKKITWWCGLDRDWAFNHLAGHLKQNMVEYDHADNEYGDINIILSPVFLSHVDVDQLGRCITHIDGNRFYEARGVAFEFPEEPEPDCIDDAVSGKSKVISLIWEKGRWSWGVIYSAIHERLEDMFDFEALEFEHYRKNRLWVPCKPTDFFFCQNVTQLASVPEINKKNAITRLGGNMNFTDNAAVNLFMEQMGKCGAIIATNQHLCKIGKLANKNTYLIPNGLNISEWCPKKEKVWNVDQPVVGFIGNVTSKDKVKYKGYNLITRVCRDMMLELKLATYKNNQIPHDKMKELFFDQIDIFILPTDGEGCSNSIMEALACGVPVITTRTAGFHGELLEDGEDVLFCEKTIESITDCFKRFISEPDLYQRLSENGRAFAIAHHDINLIAEKYREVFKKHFVGEAKEKQPENTVVTISAPAAKMPMGETG